MVSAVFCMALTSCSESNELEVVDSVISTTGEEDYKYVGKETAGFKAEEWFPGGALGTTNNTVAGCYEDETPSTQNADLMAAFKRGELLFEHDFTPTSTASFAGLGPAYVRSLYPLPSGLWSRQADGIL